MNRTVFIDTNELPRERTPGGGEMTEILNDRLAGAKNVVGTLRWLEAGDRFEAAALDRHQLLYLMDGEGDLTIEGRTHQVKKGMGVYLGPSESASVAARPGQRVKIFHLAVRHVDG